MNHATTARAGLDDRLVRRDDYVGYEVQDPTGQKAGRAEKLFVNGSGDPEYVRVRLGFLWPKRVLIPVEGVDVDLGRQIIMLR